MSRTAIRRLSEELKRIEASIAPELRFRVRIVFDDEPTTPGAIVLGF